MEGICVESKLSNVYEVYHTIHPANNPRQVSFGHCSLSNNTDSEPRNWNLMDDIGSSSEVWPHGPWQVLAICGFPAYDSMSSKVIHVRQSFSPIYPFLRVLSVHRL